MATTRKKGIVDFLKMKDKKTIQKEIFDLVGCKLLSLQRVKKSNTNTWIQRTCLLLHTIFVIDLFRYNLMFCGSPPLTGVLLFLLYLGCSLHCFFRYQQHSSFTKKGTQTIN